ncbi:hypothetical protein [Nocardia sp. CNY236]|uniref:hypothetical protein n=1 Tax=Nocardia sp. CNY236 TaxID=1169152 RepID=UPI000416CA46|nr:hypothetical protein [Nocardia sp. CNY236]
MTFHDDGDELAEATKPKLHLPPTNPDPTLGVNSGFRQQSWRAATTAAANESSAHPGGGPPA